MGQLAAPFTGPPLDVSCPDVAVLRDAGLVSERRGGRVPLCGSSRTGYGGGPLAGQLRAVLDPAAAVGSVAARVGHHLIRRVRRRHRRDELLPKHCHVFPGLPQPAG